MIMIIFVRPSGEFYAENKQYHFYCKCSIHAHLTAMCKATTWQKFVSAYQSSVTALATSPVYLEY